MPPADDIAESGHAATHRWHPSPEAQRELTLTRLFSRLAWRRIRRNLAQIENNEDALLDQAADIAYQDKGYKLS